MRLVHVPFHKALLAKQYERLIAILTDIGLKDTCTDIPLTNFQAGLREGFPQVSMLL
jgi:hypothetical protein